MILTTTALTITITCKLTPEGFVWVAQGLDHSGHSGHSATTEVTHGADLTRPENAKRCLEAFLEAHRQGPAAFTLAPCDSIRSTFVAVEVTQ